LAWAFLVRVDACGVVRRRRIHRLAKSPTFGPSHRMPAARSEDGLDHLRGYDAIYIGGGLGGRDGHVKRDDLFDDEQETFGTGAARWTMQLEMRRLNRHRRADWQLTSTGIKIGARSLVFAVSSTPVASSTRVNTSSSRLISAVQTCASGCEKPEHPAARRWAAA
jgi:hypothetical protein